MQLSGDELKTSFRMHVAAHTNPHRRDCPSIDDVAATMLPDTDEAKRLGVVDHLSRCLPCAREFAAARLLRAEHERLTPMLPDRLGASDFGPTNVVAFPSPQRQRPWRTLLRPTFALAAAASLAVVFVAGALVAHLVGRGSRTVVAIAPVGRAASADVELAWQPVASAVSYEVTMSWPSGNVFFESAPLRVTRLSLPKETIAKMKRGQTCLWTVKAVDTEGREVARETFSFLVDFDPA
jgi:hypothetical protein